MAEVIKYGVPRGLRRSIAGEGLQAFALCCVHDEDLVRAYPRTPTAGLALLAGLSEGDDHGGVGRRRDGRGDRT